MRTSNVASGNAIHCRCTDAIERAFTTCKQALRAYGHDLSIDIARVHFVHLLSLPFDRWESAGSRCARF